MNTPPIEEFDPLPPLPETPESAAEKIVRKTPWWSVSLGLHTVAALLLAFFWIAHSPVEDTPPLVRLPKVKKQEVEFKEMTVPNENPLEIDKTASEVIYTNEKPNSTVLERDDDEKFNDARGESPDMLTNRPFKGPSVSDAIGGGGGAGGLKGRTRGGQENLVPIGGGGPKTQDAVLNALKWLSRHQNPDGSWSTASYVSRCAQTCAPNPGHDDFDAGNTGLALLAFLGAGFTHLSRDVHDGLCFGDVVRKGLQWMMTHQDPEGCVGSRSCQKYMYNHTICALALAEAYGLTGSMLFRDQAQKSIDFIVASQNGGRGWRYSAKSGDTDSSVTGWAVMALKSADISGLAFPRTSYDGTRAWYDEVTEEAYGRVGYTHKGTGKVFVPGMNETFDHHEALTAIGVMSRIFMKTPKSDPRLSGGCDLLLRDKPKWEANAIDFYYWYYASLALFQYDGPIGAKWRAWNEEMKNALVKNQNVPSQGCRRGSWEPVDRWSGEGGRIYATAINALTLEVYYRYPSVFGSQN